MKVVMMMTSPKLLAALLTGFTQPRRNPGRAAGSSGSGPDNADPTELTAVGSRLFFLRPLTAATAPSCG